MQTEIPAPRSGWQGQLDRFIGPGATPAEIVLQFVPSAIAAIFPETIS